MMYVGCFLMVKMPTRTVEQRGCCSVCGLSGTAYCPTHGVKIPLIDGDVKLSIDELFENDDEVGNPLFSQHEPPISVKDYDTLILGATFNKRAWTYTSDYVIADNAIIDIPVCSFELDSWPNVIDALEQEGIPYEKRFGIVSLAGSGEWVFC